MCEAAKVLSEASALTPTEQPLSLSPFSSTFYISSSFPKFPLAQSPFFFRLI